MNEQLQDRMQEPYELISLSWPRPVRRENDRWISEPEWDAPILSFIPRPRWSSLQNELCWLIDWREFFEGGLKRWTVTRGGEMRNFHVVFRIRVKISGTLVIWDDDGSIIRRRGEILHSDRSMHPATRFEIEVTAGDELEIAQWQSNGAWLWGAHQAKLEFPDVAHPMPIFEQFLHRTKKRLLRPNGPALKLFCNGNSPNRTALAVHSLILNGFRPREVLLFGEHQWNPTNRDLLRSLLPFARIVPTDEFLGSLNGFGSPRLSEWARQYWFVMKTCVALLYPPEEGCLMDDDVFILESMEDALRAFANCDFVFTKDVDHSMRYLQIWERVLGGTAPLVTGSFNAGLYWLRAKGDPSTRIRAMLEVDPKNVQPMDWEQGFIASSCATQPSVSLPTERYFYPYYDGLPGGILGYDYLGNPCGFKSLHFGGLSEKPTEFDSLLLAPKILDRNR
jgi:hypothetical protein